MAALTGDHIAVNGTSAGAHTLFVLNSGGTPANLASALELVSTNDGVATFAAAGGHVDVGVYAYDVIRGNGLAQTPNPDNWYLAYAPAIVSDAAEAIIGTAAGMSDIWFSNLDNLHRRMGNQRLATPNEDENDAWVRGYARDLDVDGSVTGRSFDEQINGVDLGIDRLVYNTPNSKWLAGVFGGYGWADRKFNDAGSHGDTQAPYAGAYATWYDDKNKNYVDLIVKGQRFMNDFDAEDSSGNIYHGAYNNWGIGGSVEAGHRFFIGNDGWSWQPQAQAQYVYVTGQDYTTRLGTHVKVTGDNVLEPARRARRRQEHRVRQRRRPLSVCARLPRPAHQRRRHDLGRHAELRAVPRRHLARIRRRRRLPGRRPPPGLRRLHRQLRRAHQHALERQRRVPLRVLRRKQARGLTPSPPVEEDAARLARLPIPRGWAREHFIIRRAARPFARLHDSKVVRSDPPRNHDSNSDPGPMARPNPFDPGYYHEDELRDFGFKSVGRDVRVARNCTIIGLENISLGDHVRIDGFTAMIAAHGAIEIGSHVHITLHCLLAGGGRLVMEDFSGLSQGSRIYTRIDDYSGEHLTGGTVPAEYLGTITAPVTVGRHAIIGAGSTVLPGVTIGEGSAVGANSLVKSDLEPWGVYVGCPVRRVKARSRKLLEMEKKLLASGG